MATTDGITLIPATLCPYCGAKLAAVGEYRTKGSEPREGDATVCMSCTSPLVLAMHAGDITLRKPTVEESVQFGGDPDMRELIAALQLLREMRSC